VGHGFDDEAAIAAAKRGDREAFCGLVARHQEAVFRAAYLVVRDAAAAEDVAQEAFVRAYQHLRSFREGDPFRPWLLRIATNLALNEVRGRGRRQGLLARFGRQPVEHNPSPERDAVAGEQRDLVWQAINELPGDDRVVLYLRHYLELPEREIALAINKAPGTVKSRLSRAGARLRTVIEERYPALLPGDSTAGDRHD